MQWELDSGVWDISENGAALVKTPMNHEVSPQLSADDIKTMVGCRYAKQDTTQKTGFPPEFAFSPFTGEPLIPVQSPKVTSWATPNAANVHHEANMPGGLLLSPVGFRPKNLDTIEPGGTYKNIIPMPPPGIYEFVVAQSGKHSPCLFAVESKHSALSVYLPSSKTWKELQPADGNYLPDLAVPNMIWRAAMVSQKNQTILYLPSANGLCRIELDALGLCYRLSIVGSGQVIGAPIFTGSDSVFVPILTTPTQLSVLEVNATGAVVRQADISVDATFASSIGTVFSPVSYVRKVMWPTRFGRILVRRNGNQLELQYKPWNRSVQEAVSHYGVPYFDSSSAGSFWQLCRSSSSDGSFVYCELDTDDTRPVDSINICSGKSTYKFEHKNAKAPWEENANQGTDLLQFFPLLENEYINHQQQGAITKYATIGFSYAATPQLFEKPIDESVPVSLVYIDESTEPTVLETMAILQPWNFRFFVFDGCLWRYHPVEKMLYGWEIE